MRLQFVSRVSGALAGLFLIAACTLGPEPERPTTAADTSQSYAYAPEAEKAPLPSYTTA